MKINYNETIKTVEAFDIRFPTSLSGNGSDAIHLDPDYSECAVIDYNIYSVLISMEINCFLRSLLCGY